jgi:hypothetical protein
MAEAVAVTPLREWENVMRGALCVGLVTLAIALTGCGSPKVDGSSEDAYKKSIAAVRESLDEGERKQFDEALQLLMMSRIDFSAMMSGAVTAETMASDMMLAMNGKTAQELIAEANRLKAEREAKERQQAITEIAELAAKRLTAHAAKAELAKFEVVRSRFYRQRGFIGEEPAIELTVRNGTNVSVSRAYFEGTVASSGRAVPWIKEQFNYQISGGVEPGETVSWNLAPNRFSKWGEVDVPSDAVFTVVTTRLDGPDGESVFSSQDFTEDDARRLAQLREKYGDPSTN